MSIIVDARHPEYKDKITDWRKYEATYTAGKSFVEEYVEKFSERESTTAFDIRKKYSYCPAFAKGAINEVKNSIFQRISAITREGGSDSYKQAFLGLMGGVDLNGASMNAFIGREILPQLLIKAKIGVYVDMPVIDGTNRANEVNKRPYLYAYKAEDILTWDIAYNDKGYYFTLLLLKDTINTYDKESGLPDGQSDLYRLYKSTDGVVTVNFYNADGVQVDIAGEESSETTILDLEMIPFAIAGLTDSLMTDTADYQVAHTNLASSDMSYALRSNYPFYVEQVDQRMNSAYLKNSDGSGVTDNNAKDTSRSTGVSGGREYAMGAEKPDFIHPSPEPLEVSMKKQEQLKFDIRQLTHLALTNVAPKMASAESKDHDQQGLEAGLSYIGLELETLERTIARIWGMYENTSEEVTITYPRRYSLKSDQDLRKEAEELKKLLHSSPSRSYKIELCKKIASILLSSTVTSVTLEKISLEIDSAKVIDVDPEILIKDIEAGLVDLETASLARNYPEGSVEKAKTDHAERIARIKEAQEKSRPDGNKDESESPIKEGQEEKALSKETDEDSVVKDKQRGDAK